MSRVKEVKTFVARPLDMAVRLADEHCLALVDRDLLRTDMNLEWHGVFLLAANGRKLITKINGERRRGSVL